MRRRYDWVGGGVSERVGSERKRERERGKGVIEHNLNAGPQRSL